MRILIATCQQKTRSALKMLLDHQPDMHMVGEVDYSPDLAAHVEAARPDVVLLDWDAVCPPLADVLPALQASSVKPKVIVLGSPSEEWHAALAAGADGFASKTARPKSLLTTIRQVYLRGEDV